MRQRWDLFAFSLLVFSALVLTATVLDPKGFSIKEWQPLIASLVAFGGATFVFRGATLAYRAAMAKVALDERLHEATLRRQRRGLFLRLSSTVYRLGQRAQRIENLIKLPAEEESTILITADRIDLKYLDELSEAWTNLDAFPSDVALSIVDIRIHGGNVQRTAERLVQDPITLTHGERLPGRARRLKWNLHSIYEHCMAIDDFLETTLQEMKP